MDQTQPIIQYTTVSDSVYLWVKNAIIQGEFKPDKLIPFKTTKEEAIEKIKQESRRYAKRQLTWFRKNKQTIWIDGLANLEDNINIIEKELNK